MKKTNTANNPWAALDALMKADPEPMGPEWFTTEQFMVRYNLGLAASSKRLRDMRRLGKVDKWKGVSAVSRRITAKWRIR